MESQDSSPVNAVVGRRVSDQVFRLIQVPNAPTGGYLLTAKVTAANGISVTSPTVKVVVGNPDVILLVTANAAGQITIRWSNGGTLESTPSLTSPSWTPTGNSSGTFSEAVNSSGNKFYRVKR